MGRSACNPAHRWKRIAPARTPAQALAARMAGRPRLHLRLRARVVTASKLPRTRARVSPTDEPITAIYPAADRDVAPDGCDPARRDRGVLSASRFRLAAG